MTKPKQTALKKSDTLVGKLDAFASDLLASTKDMPIQQRVDIFKEVARWVGIKNRLDEADDMGEGLNGYRSKLASGAETKPDPDRGKDHRNALGRAGSAAHWGHDTSTAEDYGGSALDAIKSRLPRTDPRGHERDRDDPGGPGDDAGGGDRGLRAGVPRGS